MENDVSSTPHNDNVNVFPLGRRFGNIENLNDKIVNVRTKVLEECFKNEQLYDEIDVVRIQNDDWNIERFIRRGKTIDDAIDLLIQALKWRHEMNLSRLEDNYFPVEFFKTGAMFCYTDDKKGNGVVHMRVRFYRKTKELEHIFKQFVAYQIDQMDRQTNGNGMVIVLDCQCAQFHNYDLEMCWFLITILVNYFPYAVDYIIVNEFSRILSSMWPIINAWIPIEARNKVVLTRNDQIENYIDRSNLPYYLNGTCPRRFHLIPKDCPTLKQFGLNNGFTMQQINRLIKIYQPYLDLADEEVQVWHIWRYGLNNEDYHGDEEDCHQNNETNKQQHYCD